MGNLPSKPDDETELELVQVEPEVVPGTIAFGPGAAEPPPPVRRGLKGAVDRILRFRRSERLLHWSIALPFLVCAGSALVLVVLYNPDPSMPYREIVSRIHRISGALLVGLPLLVLLSHAGDYKLHLGNIKEAAIWTLDDFKWLALTPLAIIKKGVKLPEEGKFNAGEKMNFLAVLTMYPVMGATGLIIWTQGSALLPWLIHFSLAAAMLPLIGGHIFMATINPASRVGLPGMFTGMVDRAWASHHYRRWYKEHFRAPEPAVRNFNSTEVIPKSQFLAARRAQGMMRYAAVAVAAVVGLAALYVSRPFAARALVLTLPMPAPASASYLLEESPLLSRPVSDASPLPGKLEKLTKLTRFGEFGPYSLVQDPQGRAGYVPTRALGSEPPKPVEPEKPAPAPAAAATANPAPVANADCLQASSEPDATACVMRAEAAFTNCKEACAAEASAGCAEACGASHDSCLASCTGTSDEAKEPARPLGWKPGLAAVKPAAVKPSPGRSRPAAVKPAAKQVARVPARPGKTGSKRRPH